MPCYRRPTAVLSSLSGALAADQERPAPTGVLGRHRWYPSTAVGLRRNPEPKPSGWRPASADRSGQRAGKQNEAGQRLPHFNPENDSDAIRTEFLLFPPGPKPSPIARRDDPFVSATCALAGDWLITLGFGPQRPYRPARVSNSHGRRPATDCSERIIKSE